MIGPHRKRCEKTSSKLLLRGEKSQSQLFSCTRLTALSLSRFGLFCFFSKQDLLDQFNLKQLSIASLDSPAGLNVEFHSRPGGRGPSQQHFVRKNFLTENFSTFTKSNKPAAILVCLKIKATKKS